MTRIILIMFLAMFANTSFALDAQIQSTTCKLAMSNSPYSIMSEATYTGSVSCNQLCTAYGGNLSGGGCQTNDGFLGISTTPNYGCQAGYMLNPNNSTECIVDPNYVAPSSCESIAGQTTSLNWAWEGQFTSNTPAQVCHNGCVANEGAVSVCVIGACSADYTYTNQSCDNPTSIGGAPPAGLTPVNPDGTGGGGDTGGGDTGGGDTGGGDTGGGASTDIAQFCADNPQIAACLDTSGFSFNGQCGSEPPTCTGDAVQCQLAKQAFQTDCDNRATAPVNDLGEAIMNGQSSPSSFDNPTPIAIPSDLNGNGFLAASCPPDLSFNVNGQTITIPVSKLCPGFQSAGQLVLAFGYLAGALIVFGRKT